MKLEQKATLSNYNSVLVQLPYDMGFSTATSNSEPRVPAHLKRTEKMSTVLGSDTHFEHQHFYFLTDNLFSEGCAQARMPPAGHVTVPHARLLLQNILRLERRWRLACIVSAAA